VRIGGWLRDESGFVDEETYIGAMPGRIIQSLKKKQERQIQFCLDEIDKLSNSNQGDPSSALLEVLDRNKTILLYDNF
jgi:ATP-dependent Lon protease